MTDPRTPHAMLTRLEALNRIAIALGARTYLEVGVQRGHVFRLMRVADKVGVDPDPLSAATVHETSDAYFAALDPAVRFDLIFIDGLHLSEQVERDVANALAHLSEGGVIMLHDCDPPSELAGGREMCSGFWCGDVWRAWVAWRRLLAPWIYQNFTVDADLGLGVIRHIAGTTRFRLNPDALAHCRENLDWPTFQAQRKTLLGLVPPEQFTTWVRGLTPIPR